MRPATNTIHAPPFPRDLPWIGTAQLRVDKQIGRPLVISFFDSGRAVSLRTLLELQQWHERYAARGARIIGVHVDGDGVGRTTQDVERALQRLGITLPVVIDEELRIAEAYGLSGVPSRYIFDQSLRLVDAHFGLGGVADGERLLRTLVEHGEQVLAEQAQATPEPAVAAAEPEVEEHCDAGAAVPPARQPRLRVPPPSADALPAPLPDAAPFVAPQPAELLGGTPSGPYAAGAVWLDLSGHGSARLGSHVIEVDGPGLYLAADHGLHTEGTLDVELSGDAQLVGVQLEPGVAPT